MRTGRLLDPCKRIPEFPLATLKSISAAERDAARYMPLEGVARSDAAVTMAQDVSLSLFAKAGAGKRGRPTSANQRAVAAMLCDLLQNAEEDPLRWGFRSHRAVQFSGKAVGYRPYAAVFKGLLGEDLLDYVRGHQQHSTFGGAKHVAWMMCPRLRVTHAGLDLAASYDITPTNWRDHFEIVRSMTNVSRKPPLECRTPSTRIGGLKKKGGRLPLDFTDLEVVQLRDQVVRINSFMAKHDIVGADHSGFQRIFHASEGERCRWNKGGRLYSVQRENYQRAKKAVRAEINIDGEPVVELDLTASHLTILHALRERAFNPADDPYAIEGIPRSVVKQWVTMTLGHSKFHRSWPKKARDDLEPTLGRGLQGAFPLTKTREAILAHIPLLADWAESPIDWGDLQYVESKVMMETVETLAFTHDVPCLPVHDSIIVAAHHLELASRVLKEAFRSVVGVSPHLKVA